MKRVFLRAADGCTAELEVPDECRELLRPVHYAQSLTLRPEEPMTFGLEVRRYRFAGLVDEHGRQVFLEERR